MEKALVVSADANPLAEIIERAALSCVCLPEKTRIENLKAQFDVYIIDTPPGEKLAESLADRVSGQVILLTDGDLFLQTSERLAGRGVITVSKSQGESALLTALRSAEAAENRYNRVLAENLRLQREIEDLKVINRAKLVLVSRLGVTEPEAHRYIEKRAMDMRATKLAVAESILKTYEY